MASNFTIVASRIMYSSSSSALAEIRDTNLYYVKLSPVYKEDKNNNNFIGIQYMSTKTILSTR